MNEPARQGDAKRTAGAQWREGVRAGQSAMPKWVASRGWVRFQLIVFTLGALLEGTMAVVHLRSGNRGTGLFFLAAALMFVVFLAFSVWQWRRLPPGGGQ